MLQFIVFVPNTKKTLQNLSQLYQVVKLKILKQFNLMKFVSKKHNIRKNTEEDIFIEAKQP